MFGFFCVQQLGGMHGKEDLHGNWFLSGPRAHKAALGLKNFVKFETSYLPLDRVPTGPLLACL